jgi:hypothetical protein
MKVFVGFYTGEYTNALLDALPDKVWRNVIHKTDFGEGYAAAGGGDDYDDAFGTYLMRETADYVVVPTTSLDGFQDGVFIHATEDQLMEAARKFSRTLIQDLEGLGGDDSVYDYYPDAIEALYQLCVGIGSADARVEYEMTINNAWEEQYKAVGEFPTIDTCFPAWPKEVKA